MCVLRCAVCGHNVRMHGRLEQSSCCNERIHIRVHHWYHWLAAINSIVLDIQIERICVHFLGIVPTWTSPGHHPCMHHTYDRTPGGGYPGDRPRPHASRAYTCNIGWYTQISQDFYIFRFPRYPLAGGWQKGSSNDSLVLLVMVYSTSGCSEASAVEILYFFFYISTRVCAYIIIIIYNKIINLF